MRRVWLLAFAFMVAIAVSEMHGQILSHILFGSPSAAPGGGCSLSYTTGLVARYKADVGLTCSGTCVDGSTVTGWADQSGNSHDLTLGVSAAASIYKINQINGLPAVLLSGVGQGSNLDITGGLPTAGSNISIFVADAISPSSSNKGTLVSGLQGAFSYWTHGASTALQGVDRVFELAIGSGSATGNTSWNQRNVVFVNNGSLTFRLNRAADGSSTPNTNTTVNISKIGTNGQDLSESYFGYVNELLIYTAAVTGSNLTSVEGYLNCQTGL